RLRLCTDTAARTLLRVPAVKIDVQPVGRFGDEALEEQRTEDRAGESRGRNVAEVRHLAAELVVVAHPQRHGPQRIMCGGAGARELRDEPLVAAEQRRQLRPESD